MELPPEDYAPTDSLEDYLSPPSPPKLVRRDNLEIIDKHHNTRNFLAITVSLAYILLVGYITFAAVHGLPDPRLNALVSSVMHPCSAIIASVMTFYFATQRRG